MFWRQMIVSTPSGSVRARVAGGHQVLQAFLDGAERAGDRGECVLDLLAHAVELDDRGDAHREQLARDCGGHQRPVREQVDGDAALAQPAHDVHDAGVQQRLAAADDDDPPRAELDRLIQRAGDLLARQLVVQRLAGAGVAVDAAQVALARELQLHREQPLARAGLGDFFRGEIGAPGAIRFNGHVASPADRKR